MWGVLVSDLWLHGFVVLVGLASMPRGEVEHLSQRRVEVVRPLHDDGAVVHEHDLRPPVEGPLDADVDGGGLQLREEDVVFLGCVEVLRETGPIGQPCAPPHHLAPVRRLQVLDLPAATPPGAVVVKNTRASLHIRQRNRDEVGDQQLRRHPGTAGRGSAVRRGSRARQAGRLPW